MTFMRFWASALLGVATFYTLVTIYVHFRAGRLADNLAYYAHALELTRTYALIAIACAVVAIATALLFVK